MKNFYNCLRSIFVTIYIILFGLLFYNFTVKKSVSEMLTQFFIFRQKELSNTKLYNFSRGKRKGHTLGLHPTCTWFELRLPIDLW